MASFRDSGEAKESKQQGTKASRQRQKDIGRKAGKDLKEALDRGKKNIKGTEYTGKLADAMRTANINQFNERQLRQRALENAPQRQGIMQGLRNFGQGIMSNLSPGRMLASGIGSALFGPIGGIIAGLLANKATTDAFKQDVGDTIGFGQKLGSNLQTDFFDTVNFFRPNFNVDTPDADIVRAGDFNFLDRITDAIAAPNISTGVETLFAPRGTGLPEDFLDQSAVETQQLNPVATGMQYDDFINPDTGMFFNPELGSFDKMQ
jgi:hypothetical protein